MMLHSVLRKAKLAATLRFSPKLIIVTRRRVCLCVCVCLCILPRSAGQQMHQQRRLPGDLQRRIQSN